MKKTKAIIKFEWTYKSCACGESVFTDADTIKIQCGLCTQKRMAIEEKKEEESKIAIKEEKQIKQKELKERQKLAKKEQRELIKTAKKDKGRQEKIDKKLEVKIANRQRKNKK